MTLKSELKGAVVLRHSKAGHVYWAWFGGHTIYGYDSRGKEIAMVNVGDFAEKGISMAEARKFMSNLVKRGKNAVKDYSVR